MASPIRIVFLPGLGADHRLLEPQQSINAQIEVVKWIAPLPRESFCEYADRLGNSIDTSQPFVLGGISLGGMFAQEIARRVNPLGLILLSTCRANRELPWIYRCVGLSAFVAPLFAINAAKSTMGMLRRTFGVVNAEQAQMIDQMLADTDPRFIRWSIRALLGWRGVEKLNTSTLHIQGSDDRIIPARRTRPDHIVQGAGHVMNLTHAAEVNRIIDQWLEQAIMPALQPARPQ